MKIFSTVLAAVTFLAFVPQVYAESGKVDYPEGYRQWVHIKSMLIKPGHPLENPFQGMHHVYGNGQAIKGLKNGSFANGAVLVFDLLQYNEGGHAIQEDERKFIGVMQKDEKKFNATGGWGFEAFAKNSKTKRVVGDGGKSCFSCHTSQKDRDFVFTQLRN
jgi:hypothetical protein